MAKYSSHGKVLSARLPRSTFPIIFSFLAGATPLAAPVSAQITPDNTLGSEASTVISDIPVQGDLAELIEGGAIRGTNLFHSFSDFNVETLQRVYFANPAGIETILTRVTGGNGTSIDGTLGVDGLADLYLLNPNGIAFGPNAQLDIRGSFVASTADSWNLGDGMVFSAVDSEAPPLLAVTLTPGLQYGTAQQADITNDGNLAVAPEARLVLMGDTVTHTGMLTAPGGNVQLLGNRVGVFGSGQIDVSSATGGGTVNLGGGFQGQGPLPTAQQTVVGPNASLLADATATGNGGEIIVWSDGLTRFYGSASARGGAVAGNGGLVEVSGLEQLVYDGQVDTTAANGAIGTLLLDPNNIRVVNDAIAELASLADVDEFDDLDIGNDGDTLIAASTISGSTSNIVLQAMETISFEALTALTTPSVGIEATAVKSISVIEPIVTSGGAISLTAQDIAISSSIASAGGDITIAGENSVLLNSSAVIESGDIFSGVSDAGRVSVNTIGNLTLTEGSQIRAGAVFMGSGGDIDVSAGSISLSGTGLGEPSGIISQISPGTSTPGGKVTVVADNIFLAEGAAISTQNQGEGIAGDLAVTANQRLELDGLGTNIGSPVFSTGSGGDVEIIADDIVVTNGATIASSTLGSNELESNLSVTANQRLELDGLASEIGSNVFTSGRGANVTVNASEIIIINGALISTSTFDDGDNLTINDGAAGNLSVSANRIEIDGFSSVEDALTGEIISFGASRISSDVRASGPGGDVTVEADNILVTDGAVITTSNIGSGAAGSLLVTAQQIELDGFALVDNTPMRAGGIASNVFASGDGGDVIVDAPSIFVTNGATISTSNNGEGTSGSLLITGERVQVDGFAFVENTPLNASSIEAEVLSSGNSNKVTIDANNVSVTGGAIISTSSRSSGESGDLLVMADRIQVDGFASIEETLVGVSGIGSRIFGSGSGGDVMIGSSQVPVSDISVMNGGSISVGNRGTGEAGNLTVTANQIDLDGFASLNNELSSISSIDSEVLSSGTGGDVVVDASTVSIVNGARISASNFSSGISGNLTVAAEQIDLDGFASVVELNNFIAFDISSIRSEVFSSGSGGEIIVDSTEISVSNGAFISTSNRGAGEAGTLFVVADEIAIDGFAAIDNSLLSSSGIGSEIRSVGDGGEAIIGTPEAPVKDISVTNGAIISTSNRGFGVAGNLSIAANEITLDGFASTEDMFFGTSGIISEATAVGIGGSVTVGTPDVPINNISVSNGARISTITSGLSDAADIEIQVADEIELDAGFISSASNLTNADSGDVFLDAGDLILRNGSGISAGTFAVEGIPNAAAAAAGEVDVTAERIFLDRSGISTTGNLGDGGNLFVEASDFLLLRNNSQISTTAGLLTSGGNGGNIIVDAPFVVGVLTEDSDITANAFLGDGGTVTVTALDIIGLEFQDNPTPFSDITASSEEGDAGVTEFNRLTDINPEDSLDEIPIDLTDPASLIDRQCALQATPTASEFTVVGRGGLPIDPSQPSIAETFLEDLGGVPETADTANEQARADAPDEDAAPFIQEPSTANVIREAQGWIQDDTGRTYLVSATPQGIAAPSLVPVTCQYLNETEMLELPME